MGSRLVRVRDEDYERITQTCGLGGHAPFSAKVQAILGKLASGGDLDAMRRVVREELERVAGG